MDLLIQVQDNDAPFLVELLSKFDFVKVKQAKTDSLINSLDRSVSQIHAMRKGKMHKPSVSELFSANE